MAAEFSSHDLHAFMAQVSHEMSSEYERIRKRTQEDPGTAGDQGEENWAALLREWLPSSYAVVTKGRLIGHNAEATPQIDVLVLKPGYPTKLLNKKLYLAGGVAAAFECKTTLRSSHIKKAISNCIAAKNTLKKREGSPYKELHSPLVFGLLAHSHEWKAPNSKPVENVAELIRIGDMEQVTHPRLCLDLVCVADLVCFHSMAISYYDLSWSDNQQTGISAATTMAGAAVNADRQAEGFQPIGAFITHLARKLAWEDISLRPFADYYNATQLGGNGQGQIRVWPSCVYSASVRDHLPNKATNGVSFDEWSMALY